ncbi:MAG: signal peptidase II [Thermoanaerobaculia bacterium]
MPNPRLSSDARTKPRFLLIALAVLAADQWSKWLVERRLDLHESVPVIPGCLDFTHVSNTGVAFGLLPAHGDLTATLLLTALGLVALGVIGYYFFRTPADQRLLLTSLSLVLGGAVGNLLDRIAAGAVTDFIDFYVGDWHWHTFNVADSAITVGIVLMAFELLLARRRAPVSQAESL